MTPPLPRKRGRTCGKAKHSRWPYMYYTLGELSWHWYCSHSLSAMGTSVAPKLGEFSHVVAKGSILLVCLAFIIICLVSHDVALFILIYGIFMHDLPSFPAFILYGSFFLFFEMDALWIYLSFILICATCYDIYTKYLSGFCLILHLVL